MTEPSRHARVIRWARPAHLVGVVAIAVGAGLILWPNLYTNPAYRVVLSHWTARQAGFGWVTVGALAAFRTRPWTVALFGSALIGWGLGLAAAAWLYRTGSPFGWLWIVALGLVVLRNLDTEPLGV